MNDEKKCMIIRDLLINYSENLVSEPTKEFVDNHINSCSDCKDILEMIKKEKLKEIIEKKYDDSMEFNYLKKYNKKMFILKIILALILIITFIFFVSYLVKLNHINTVLQTSYNNVQELNELDNYKLTVKQHTINYSDMNESSINTEYYFLNNNYKKSIVSELISNKKSNKVKQSYYGNNNSNERIIVYEDTKKITHSDNAIEENYIEFSYSEIYSEANLSKWMYIFRNSRVKIRSDRFNGKICYVLRYQSNTNAYREIWIDKETMLPIRIIQDIFDDYYNEKTIILNTDIVTEHDIVVPQSNEYTIETIN